MRIAAAFLLALCLVPAVAPIPAAAKGYGVGHHYVHGYTNRHGTVVHGYHRTNPNHSRADNWSTRGNVNPYTGKAGTKPLWRPSHR